jgi:hypothetical protein
MSVRLSNDISCLLWVGHIKRQWQDGLAEAICKIGKFSQIAGSGRNLISSLQCGFRTNATKPTRGAGDEAYFFKMWMFLLILIGCLTASDS